MNINYSLSLNTYTHKKPIEQSSKKYYNWTSPLVKNHNLASHIR